MALTFPHRRDAPAAPSGTEDHAEPAPGATVHRRPVVTLDGHVLGYSVTVAVEAPGVPQPRTPGRAGPGAEQGVSMSPHRAYLRLDLANLVADRYVFLPATPEMLEGDVPSPVVPGRLVLTLPLGFESEPDALAQATALRRLGVHLALADYRAEPAQNLLLSHLAFVLVTPGPDPLEVVVQRAHRSGVRVVATGVVDFRTEDACRAAGVDAVLGGRSERSPLHPDGDARDDQPGGAARVLRAGEAQCLAIMHLLNQPDVDLPAVSQVIDTDPVLTLRVLHLVNSGAFGLRRQVDTVHQAAVLIGAREVGTLVTALMVDARPDGMDCLWLILARALACEALAEDSAAYTVGMLSALAEQLGVPVSVILDKVGVSAAVADAVRSQAGPYGRVLAAVRGHERADSHAVVTAGLLPQEVSDVYMRAVADALATARTVTPQPVH